MREERQNDVDDEREDTGNDGTMKIGRQSDVDNERGDRVTWTMREETG